MNLANTNSARLIDLIGAANGLLSQIADQLKYASLEEKYRLVGELSTVALLWSRTTEKLGSLISAPPTRLLLMPAEQPNPQGANAVHPHPPASTIRREVAPGVFIRAFEITSEDEVHLHRGWFCWCDATARFSLSLNGHIIAGVTTIINSADRTPIKYHEHRDCQRGYCSTDWRETNYFVPREMNPTSRDVRQLTNRAHFVPASRSLATNDRYAYRLGSRDTLKMDIAEINSADLRLYRDMTINHLLTLIAALTKQ